MDSEKRGNGVCVAKERGEEGEGIEKRAKREEKGRRKREEKKKGEGRERRNISKSAIEFYQEFS